ncbi:hypothetical protein LMG7141_00944 [Ralstonia condita]|jgi:hypothetical protein|uniref:Uncharacterized protein n=1 Tax=Ralstonia condita TaxID=3058600 RepID=A0ABM9J208_9RALS|nr:hypothetical protein [Ralstonia sp. LMG 7141]MDE2203876.1 hypothetical protein [Burkholderiaceae bacterium]CAJ0779889.1 hypothetical protein LMG7141_00944 [Ralstonia sp. LMG 7141]
MTEPFAYLAFEPKGPGLMCALMVIVEGDDVYGWYTGPAKGSFPAAFFMLERYYSTHETAFYHSVQDDVYAGWRLAYPPVEIDAGRQPPVQPPMCHALEQRQDAFLAAWLFYRDDPGNADEVQWYATQHLPLGHTGIRHEQLNRFAPGDVIWSYASPGLDLNIVEFLRRRWPLDFALAA